MLNIEGNVESNKNSKRFDKHEEKIKNLDDKVKSLESLCSRVDHLENLISRHNNNKDELQVVKNEQPIDLESRKEQQVYAFIV